MIIFECSKYLTMATLKYFTKGNSNPTTIYLRFLRGRQFDLQKTTSLLIDPKYWNNSKGVVRQISENTKKLNLQNDLNALKSTVLNTFNTDYANGVIIDSNWLNNVINSFFEQDVNEDLNLLLDFAEYYLKNLSNKVQRNGNTGVSTSTIKKYKTVVQKIKDFEKHSKKRFKIVDVNTKFHKDLIYFFHDVQLLNYNTTGRYLKFIKTICLDAKKNGVKIHDDLTNGNFLPPKEKVHITYLNEDEINLISKHDFSKTPYLENARDWLIIGVWTGARVSDLLKLTDKNIVNDYIEFVAQKTNQKIILPVHNQVEYIVNKLNGKFPRRISDVKFNDYIKTVCSEVKLNNLIIGSKKIEVKHKVWRKVVGKYPKHDLVSSHICRRSFATNHYGKLPTPVIMAITGHSTEKMFLKYIGKTSKDNAEVLNEFWKTQQLKQKREPQLEIIKNGTK
jgi:integrase